MGRQGAVTLSIRTAQLEVVSMHREGYGGCEDVKAMEDVKAIEE